MSLGVAAAVLGVVAGHPPRAHAQDPAAPEAAPAPATCSKSEFESAVDNAAEALRELNNKNRPEFQARLRKLKEKRAWTDDQFMKEAEPFVKDEEISVFDSKTSELLASISAMGQEGANAPEPDCSVLTELRGLMQVLVDTQTTKWTYMFKKLDDEIAK
ncbi:MAG: hypothetical protein AB7S70_06675 [Hyphomicrobium sp.]|uniref:hypothetical protein n=1 Tax=Hyphomicrobium sp. TaxID=82 RepID=UPI003D0F930C